MANIVKLKRSAVASAVPTTAQLELGELAINTTDGKLFLKRNNGTESIVEVGAAGGTVGTLAVANGGTGATTFTTGRLLVGQGTSAITSSLIEDNGTTVTIGNIAVTSGSINSTSVGATTASTGAFTTLSGSGAVTFGSSVGFNSLTAAMSLGGNHTTGVFTIGGASGTGILTLGRSTASQTTNIQAGATASGSTKTINLGTEGLAGSTTTITIGSAAGTSTTTLNGAVSVGSTIATPLGSAAAPSYTFTGDTNTGMWSPGPDTLAFSEGGVEVMRINSSGIVAIGRTTGLEGSLTLADYINIARNTDGWLIKHQRTDDSRQMGLYVEGHATPNLAVYTNGLERMRVMSEGNVGIGNISPGYKLSVTGTAEITAAKEGVFTITDGATVNLDPNNGSIQSWTLGASRTPGQVNWATGQSMTLMIDDGTAFAVTWTTLGVVWKTNAGVAPTLATTGFTVIVLWKVGSTIYGARVGDA